MRQTFVTDQQAAIHALFLRHRSMSEVARKMGLSQIRVREALVQYQRNCMRDLGLSPPPLRKMMLGDVMTRFCAPPAGIGGRPAKHLPAITGAADRSGDVRSPWVRSTASGDASAAIAMPLPQVGSSRFIVTSMEVDAELHVGFWSNLKAYSERIGAKMVVVRLGSGPIRSGDVMLRTLAGNGRISVGPGVLDVIGDAARGQPVRPFDGHAGPRDAAWNLVGHPAIQMETLARMRAGGLRMQMTTGAVTMPRRSGRGPRRREVGAVIAEVASDGHAHCRHLLADCDGPGDFSDLDVRVSKGMITFGNRVEALVFGDVHHAHLDAEVASKTWGVSGKGNDPSECLVDRLRPRTMVFHDVCDFSARSHHDARDPHRRFALASAGMDCVRTEIEAVAAFLRDSRREWCQSVVVRSNHDQGLVRWLREGDFRTDPINAEFFLECSLALLRRLAAGHDSDGYLEEVLRSCSDDGLAGVRFLASGEGLELAGIECGIHGHISADGKRGSMPFFEGLGMRAVLGHTHRPTTRGDLCTVGVCQPDLVYARGPLTAWATGHVIVHEDGTRQHLIFDGGRFFS